MYFGGEGGETEDLPPCPSPYPYEGRGNWWCTLVDEKTMGSSCERHTRTDAEREAKRLQLINILPLPVSGGGPGR